MPNQTLKILKSLVAVPLYTYSGDDLDKGRRCPALKTNLRKIGTLAIKLNGLRRQEIMVANLFDRANFKDIVGVVNNISSPSERLRFGSTIDKMLQKMKFLQ